MCSLEAACRKSNEKQIELQNYNFAKEKSKMDMEDLTQAGKELQDKCDYHRSQVNEIFKDRKAKEAEIRTLDGQLADYRKQALGRLEELGKDKVDQYNRLLKENKEMLSNAEQQRRQLTDLTLAVNSQEEALKQDPLRKKGAQLTADKKMYEEQLRDLNEQEDDESLPFDEAKKRLLKKIKDDNEQIQDMENQKSSISNQIKEMKEKIHQVEANLEASKGGQSEKHKQLQVKDAEMTKYLEGYKDQKDKLVKNVISGEKNIVHLLRHISSELSRSSALPSQGDVSQMKGDLAFKQSQFENAETTLQRVTLELNERKQDLERVEELERKMNQEMDNLNQKMEEMREEIVVFENLDALKARAEHEKRTFASRKKVLKKRRDALKVALRVQADEFEKKRKSPQDQEKITELETLEKKLRAMEDNLFVMKEFVNEKGAETNIGPIKDEVRGLSYEINQMLVAMQQKAA